MYVRIVKKYLEYIKGLDNLDFNSESNIKELLRYSLCYGFNLPSKASTNEIEGMAEECSRYILNGIAYDNFTVKTKQGIIEACIHMLDMILRERVGK